jgi:hypothetical protein
MDNLSNFDLNFRTTIFFPSNCVMTSPACDGGEMTEWLRKAKTTVTLVTIQAEDRQSAALTHRPITP